MKLVLPSTPRAAAHLVGVLVLMLFCAGCLEKRIVWSPDGSQAAIIAGRHLYLCDGDGKLSATQVPDVAMAAWLGDSKHLVLVRTHESSDWNEIAAALGGQRTAVESQIERIWTEIQGGASLEAVVLMPGWNRREIQRLLREKHGAELESRFGGKLREKSDQSPVMIYEIVLARANAGEVSLDRVRHTGVGSVIDLRPDPTARYLAYTAEMPESKATIHLLRLDDTAAPVSVADYTAGYPDWSSDGRSLFYIQAQPSRAENAIELGVLAQRRVLDGTGRIELAEKPDELAGALFNPLTHVRCLKDGRILFNASELTLPLAAADFEENPREQLFVCAPGKQATLGRVVPRRSESALPQALSFFEVSPDETQILFGGMKGEVAVLTLATGSVVQIQASSPIKYQGVPTWRRAGEFTYIKRMPEQNEKSERPAEVVLRQGDKETTLSQSWPTELLSKVAEKN